MLAQHGQAAAGGVGVEGHEEQQDYQEEDIAENGKRAGQHRRRDPDELSRIDRLHDGGDLLLLDPEALQRVPRVHHHLIELVGVLREQLGKSCDGDDQGEGEEAQYKVGREQQHD